jgi:IMP dehydrogenase
MTETRAWHAVGLDHYRFATLYQAGVRKFCLDVAHAHSLALIDFFKEIDAPDAEWMVGNVATAEGARWLLDNTPANSIKGGIGPGSVCTTREVTGHGVPQLTAIQEIAQEVRDEVTIIADGGIRSSGDIVKALAAGAHMVMIGRLFAAALECKNDGMYWGCASGQVNNHRAPEGVTVKVTPTPEPLEDIVKRLAWGLRSGISYSGATDILSLQDNAVFIPASGATQIEGRTR